MLELSCSHGSLDLQLPMQSMPITTKAVSWNPVHGEVYSIQHCAIKFVSYRRKVGGFRHILHITATTPPCYIMKTAKTNISDGNVAVRI